MDHEKFNEKFKVGQTVIYTDDFGGEHRTKTRSEAWNLCGTTVVKIEGKTGGYDISRMIVIADVIHEEGDECPELDCSGMLVYGDVEGCSCHISPPCSACVDNPLTCTECDWVQEDE